MYKLDYTHIVFTVNTIWKYLINLNANGVGMYQEKLAQIRKKLGFSQEQMSTQIGISYRAYTSYERGDRNPSLEFIEKLAEKFNVDLNWLFVNKGEMFLSKQSSASNDELEQKVIEIMQKYGVIE